MKIRRSFTLIELVMVIAIMVLSG
ncbi:MAG: prepilin-type N-terminal cleavage/methylation domain-containing protein [Candidatus Omnitrophica bacterium]|nr:prepilin-type N-terminal cleavage/methylation domain-containing protein [Candidatus Omnitrophota bacterium]